MKKIIVNKNDSNQRLDKFMAKMFKTMPNALLYKYIRLKCVRVNGVQVKDVEHILSEGDELSFYIKDEFFNKDSDIKADLKGIKPNFKVVYEDENILIVDKPTGLLCQPDIHESRNTLINHIKAYLMAKNEYIPDRENSFAPSLCNRIDQNTQGLVLAAKNAEALKIMNEKIKNREIKKFYECLVFGELNPPKAVLRAYLKKDGDENIVEISDTPDIGGGYKEITTAYEVMKTDGDISWLRVELVTGRTHQIRAHLAFKGHPLLGDTKYGTTQQNKGYPFKYQALSSCQVYFELPTFSGILEYLRGKTFYTTPFFADWTF